MRPSALLVVACAGLASLACSESLLAPARPGEGPGAERKSVVVVARSPGVALWEPLDVQIEEPASARAAPLTDADLAEPAATSPALAGASAESLDTLLREGLVIEAPLPTSTRMGAFYKDLGTRGGPTVLTLDALYELAHLAIAEAIAEVDARVVLPAITTMLARVEAALTREARGSASDLLAPYAVARGVVAVARTLVDPAYAPPIDEAEAVAREIGKIQAQKEADSPLLGVRVQYAALSLRAGAGVVGATSPRARVFRALTWLSLAPLALREPTKGLERVGLARTHARATLLLARAVRSDVDPEAARAWDRVEAVGRFLVGPADEPTLRDVDRLAESVGLDLRDGAAVVDVTRVDKVRRAIAQAAHPRLDDGAGAWVRFFAPRYAPDAEVVSVLASRSPDTLAAADGLVAWLRDSEAKQEAHDSVYLSLLDAAATIARPSVADVSLPAAATPRLAARRAELARAAWATMRHDFLAPGVALLDRAPVPAAAPDPPPCFVEPHPEAIAKLLATVRQTQRGLTRLGALGATSPARAILGHADELLTGAFEVAYLAASDEAATSDQRRLVASIPAWLDALEWAVGSETPRAVDVHEGRTKHVVLEETTGGVGRIALVVREPGSGKLIVAAGGVVPSYEILEPSGARLGDATWRARLRAGNVPAPR